MNDLNLDQLVVNHYEGKALSPDRLRRMAALVEGGPIAGDSTSGKAFRITAPRRSMPWFAAAAAVLLTVSAIGLLELRSGSSLARLFTTGPVKLPEARSPLDADIIVLKFCADWCQPSFQIAPLYQDLKTTYDAQRVLFIDLDLTDDHTRRQAELLVQSLGIEDVWDEQGGLTGEVLYVDAATRSVIEIFNDQNDFDEMNLALHEAILARAPNG